MSVQEQNSQTYSSIEPKSVNPEFKYLIVVEPLGLMYGSAGAFLSPENLVGRSGEHFPPGAATLSGLIFSANNLKDSKIPKTERDNLHKTICRELFVAGPFWAETKNKQNIYVPMPWTKVIGEEGWDEWSLQESDGKLRWHRQKHDLDPAYSWLPTSEWEKNTQTISKNGLAKKSPWTFTPILHPRMDDGDRSVVSKDGLFLENAVQMNEGTCLVYLSTYPLEKGWYRFGGENHIVEIDTLEINPNGSLYKLLRQKIDRSFALITPGVWGSNRFSYRYPNPAEKSPAFPEVEQMLTDKPISFRFSAGSQLGRGRYAVPAGSTYVLKNAIDKCWTEWDETWFANQKFSLKHMGCGLSLPLKIKGWNDSK